MKKYLAIIIFLSISLSSNIVDDKEYVKEKIDEFIIGMYDALSAGGRTEDLSIILGDEKSFNDFIKCFPVIPIPPSFLYYEVKTYKIADGRYESENCGAFNLKIIEEFKNGQSHGVRETYYANGKLMVRERFENNEFHGLLESYNEDGSENYSLCYEKNRIVDMSICKN